MQRIKLYSQISTSLAALSNENLKQILADAKPMHEGIGGKSALISIDDTPVFVKKVPLTFLEQLPQHFMSTANLFNLPLGYQYGVGSAGFGAWRELATHIMTTSWVIAAECANFPIMYHWRILPSGLGDININYWGDIEKYCQYWENSDVIRQRIEELNKASAYIVLFLEYIPHNLHEWLSAQIAKGNNAAESAVTFVDEHLKATNRYMNTHGLMHFDAHFNNILTDGKQLYLSDFGLALSSKFDLTPAEIEFLKQHQSYDQACAAVNLLHCIITSLFGKDHFEIRLREYLVGEFSKAPPVINTIINRYAPMALLMDEFFQKLQKENKSTPYPARQVEKLLRTISSETT
jgi:serine/threonine protein kinase